jgi:hypothetical protein
MDSIRTKLFLYRMYQLQYFLPSLPDHRVRTLSLLAFIADSSAIIRHDILDEACLVSEWWEFSEEFLVGEEFVLESRDGMEAVDRGDDLTFLCGYQGVQVLNKFLVGIHLHSL